MLLNDPALIMQELDILPAPKDDSPIGTNPPRQRKSKITREHDTSKSAKNSTPPNRKDGSELSHLSADEVYKIVFTHAGKLIAIKDWSQHDLADRLSTRFRKAPCIEALAKRAALKMVEIGALDDVRFALGFLRNRLTKNSLSSSLRDLMTHGIDKDVAQVAIDELTTEGLIGAPHDQAFAVWHKKFNRFPIDDKDRAKQARFMASRGFSFDAINKVWAKAKAELELDS